MSRRNAGQQVSRFSARAFGAFLKSARERAALSQEELAVKANLAQQAISAIERGGVIPTLTSIEAIANALSYDVFTLLEIAFQRRNPKRETDTQQILEKLAGLSDESLSLAVQQIDTLSKWDARSSPRRPNSVKERKRD